MVEVKGVSGVGDVSRSFGEEVADVEGAGGGVGEAEEGAGGGEGGEGGEGVGGEGDVAPGGQRAVVEREVAVELRVGEYEEGGEGGGVFGDEFWGEEEGAEPLASGSQTQEGFQREERQDVLQDLWGQFAPDSRIHWRGITIPTPPLRVYQLHLHCHLLLHRGIGIASVCTLSLFVCPQKVTTELMWERENH